MDDTGVGILGAIAAYYLVGLVTWLTKSYKVRIQNSFVDHMILIDACLTVHAFIACTCIAARKGLRNSIHGL